MRPSPALASTLLGAALLAAPVRAEPIDRHFRAPAYACPSGAYARADTHVAEWRVHGDTDEGLTVEGYWRDTGRARFEGQLWWVDAVQGYDDVHLAGPRDRALFRIPDLLAEPPELQVLDRDGAARADCTPRLEPVPPARERMEALLDLLGAQAPTPEDAARAREALAALPPPDLLPELDRSTLPREIEAAGAGFEERHRTATLAAAADSDGSDVVAALVEAWLGADAPRLPREDAELLLEAQRARAPALAAAGRDPAQALAAATAEVLCARLEGLDGLEGRWGWEERLELATGLPLGHWTRERAGAFLEAAGTCPDGGELARTIAERRPAIEARGAGAHWLAGERERLLAVPLTLEAVAAADWLQPDRAALARRGLSARKAEEVLGPALAAHRVAAAEALAGELVAELAAGDVPLEEYPIHCARRLSAPGLVGSGELHTAVVETCRARAAQAFEEEFRARLREREAAMGESAGDGAAAPGAGLARFDLAPQRGPLTAAWDARGPFREAASRLMAELDAAEARSESAYRAALETTLAQVEADHAAADPAEADVVAAAPACAEVLGPDKSTGVRMTPLLELCGRLARERSTRAEAAACDRLWDEARAPEGLRRGVLALPFDLALSSGIPAMTLDELVCLGRRDGVDMAVEARGDAPSPEHRLVHRLEWGGAPVVVSARLVPPAEEGGPWTLADGRAVRGGGDERPLAGPSDRLLRCVLAPADCSEIAAP